MKILLFCLMSTTISAQMVAILAPDVACRSGASREATLVAELGFPAVVEVVPTATPTGRWVSIKAEENWHCFVSASYTTSFDEQKPEQALQAIANHTLREIFLMRARNQLAFGRLNIIHNLFEMKWRGVDIEGSAQLQLQELQLLKAITKTFSRCYRGGSATGCLPLNIRDWLQRHQGRISYHEIGGGWIVEPDIFWSLHDKYRQTPIADEIAWVASNHSWRGECEGSLLCNTGPRRGLHYNGKVEYIKRHPDGKYRTEAAAALLEKLNSLLNTRNEYTCRWNRFQDFPEEVREEHIKDHYAKLTGQTKTIASIITAADLDVTIQNAMTSILDGIAQPCN